MKDTYQEDKMRSEMLKIDKFILKLSDEMITYTVDRICKEMDLRSQNRIKHNIERLERMQNV